MFRSKSAVVKLMLAFPKSEQRETGVGVQTLEGKQIQPGTDFSLFLFCSVIIILLYNL